MANLAQQAVDAVAVIYGRHDGFRALHAKGRVYRGRFTASPAAAELTRAAHMQGDPVDVTVRLSNGSGNPDNHDGRPDGRGLATKFYLPDGSRTDIVAVSLPKFLAKTPEVFVEFTKRQESPPKLLLYGLQHPKTLMAGLEIQRSLHSTPSYANVRYNGLHAFKWIPAEGAARFVRYSWMPDAGEESLPKGEAMKRDANYLQDEFAERLNKGPVRFTLRLQIAADGDVTDDARVTWPDDREFADAGTLEIIEPDASREQGDDILVFDPTRITDGIELSDDQIITFRRKAYDVSVARRSGVSLADSGED
jgi:catalase